MLSVKLVPRRASATSVYQKLYRGNTREGSLPATATIVPKSQVRKVFLVRDQGILRSGKYDCETLLRTREPKLCKRHCHMEFLYNLKPHAVAESDRASNYSWCVHVL